jgi:hypothetical protein
VPNACLASQNFATSECSGKTLRTSPRASLCLEQVHGGLYEWNGFGVPDPNDLEARLLAPMFDPNKVTRSHLFTDARQQSATSAYAASDYLLSEGFPSLVSAAYGHDKLFVFPTIGAAIHTAAMSRLRAHRSASMAQRYRSGWLKLQIASTEEDTAIILRKRADLSGPRPARLDHVEIP